MVTLSVKIRVSWWLRWYLAGVRLAVLVTGCEPDWGKVRLTVCKAVNADCKP